MYDDARRDAATPDFRATPRWFRTVFSMLDSIEIGALTFILPDGRRYEARGARPGPEGEMIVRDPRLFWRMIRDGELGFAEAYVEGWWDSPDLQAVLDAALLNNEAVARGFGGRTLTRIVERLRHAMNANTRRGARRNISAHYDLGNEFYAAWLDGSMTYSSALFDAEETALAAAQRAKYAAICDRIGAPEGGRVLEIGCGWGGFAEYAAKERGLNVTALTISREQHDFARKRLFEAGLAERAQVVLRDYRDETGQYDGAASIEMFEAVGERYWPIYFDSLRDRLKPGATATLQVITIADKWFAGYRRGVDFVQKHIFPGGMLPSPSILREQTARAELDWTGARAFGESYSRTLRLWRARFEARWDEIAPLGFDDRFRRMWNFYLTSCAACFQAGTTDVIHVALRRPA